MWEDPHATLRALGVDDAGSVLDLGCGDGFFTVPLAELVDGPVYGVDDGESLASAVRSVLAGGGRFAVVDRHDRLRAETVVDGEARSPPTEMRLTAGETREAVEPAGSDHVETVELQPYHYGVVFERT